MEGLSFGEAHCAARSQQRCFAVALNPTNRIHPICTASGKRCNDVQRSNIPHRRLALPELRTSLRPSHGARHHINGRALPKISQSQSDESFLRAFGIKSTNLYKSSKFLNKRSKRAMNSWHNVGSALIRSIFKSQSYQQCNLCRAPDSYLKGVWILTSRD